MKSTISLLQAIQIITLSGVCIFLNSPGYAQNSENNPIQFNTFEELQQFLSYPGDSRFLLSCHRGGPENNLPENCIATFENTITHTRAILEVDPRYTKDSVIVLLHDPTLDRTTTGNGNISDFTFDELKQINLKNLDGNVTSYKIPTLNETLQWARGKAILLLDKKNVPIEKRLEIVKQNKANAYVILMAYSFEEAKMCYHLDKKIMMQVFINSSASVLEFDKTGVPWRNIVAFVGHQKPENPEIIDMIHQRGALCIMGTSRNLDLLYSKGKEKNTEALKNDYLALFKMGVDIIETDIPVSLSKNLFPR
jgi:glycerophosphoryl diester phosphodiesterase